jgi:glycosyltransferase involved in cell wall biosynthesis
MFQLVREWPPGYGGVERVAHEVASAFVDRGMVSEVFTLVAQPQFFDQGDPLPVAYRRTKLARLRFAELLIPLPCRSLIRLLGSPEPLHAHLPCPSVLILAALAKVVQPERLVTMHWHAFLTWSPSIKGVLIRIYQHLALWLLPIFDRVITTSPVLQDELIQAGLDSMSIAVLPCCLSAHCEQLALSIKRQRVCNPSLDSGIIPTLRLISISRLGSYKRVDWLLDAMQQANQKLQCRGLPVVLHLDVVGDGPDRNHLQHQAKAKLPGLVSFHGRVDEQRKLALLKDADLLVLLAASCNEAFGIVQLEAMACGVAAVALSLPRSGMAWVSKNPVLPWNETLEALPQLIEDLALDPCLQVGAGQAARDRYLSLFERQRWLKQLAIAFPEIGCF